MGNNLGGLGPNRAYAKPIGPKRPAGNPAFRLKQQAVPQADKRPNKAPSIPSGNITGGFKSLVPEGGWGNPTASRVRSASRSEFGSRERERVKEALKDYHKRVFENVPDSREKRIELKKTEASLKRLSTANRKEISAFAVKNNTVVSFKNADGTWKK